MCAGEAVGRSVVNERGWTVNCRVDSTRSFIAEIIKVNRGIELERRFLPPPPSPRLVEYAQEVTRSGWERRLSGANREIDR